METKLPTVWTDGKAKPGIGSEMEKVRQEKIRDGEEQKGRKTEERKCRCAKRSESRETLFQCCVAPEGRRVGAKAAGAEPLGQKRVEQVHAVVARSTFGSKKCQSTSGQEHFLKLRR